jgi:pimeloyl-ACP methyl ester carboxylesterase
MNDFVTLFRHNEGKRIAHKLIRYMSERAKYRERWVGPLARTRVPLRFINGLADPVSGAHLVKRFREVLPHSDIIELIEIGHFPHFETPAETLRLFFDFHDKIR